MGTNMYYIIAGIAILFSAYLVVMKKMAAKNQSPPEPITPGGSNSKANNPRPAPTPGALDEKKRKLLSYGAILAYHKREEILGITPKSNLDQYVQGLSGQWEISNTQQAHERISALIALYRSKEFDEYLITPSADIEKIRKKIAKALKIDINLVNETTSTYGWDIARAVPLIKWCYWTGYISEEECWSYMEDAVSIAKQHGKDWTDYTVSFLLGRTMQGFDLDDICVEASFILHSKKPLLGKVEDIDVYLNYSFK